MGLATVRGLFLIATLVVCFAQAPPALSPDSAATVIAINGSVSVLRDSYPWALAEGNSVRAGQMIVTGADGYAKFQVSDGSTFEVFPSSKVMFRRNPSNWGDLLDLELGRIKVWIQHLGGLPNHNRVHTPTAIISVRGTIFDVTVDDGDSTLVVVEEGQVEVAHRHIPGSKLLNPGEWLRVNRNEPLAQRSIEKGSVLKAVLRAASDAVYVALSNPGSTPGGTTTSTGGSTGTGVGDHGSKTPAPPAPPTSGGGTTTPAPAPPPSSGGSSTPAPAPAP
jgi:hypothetical protein